MVRITLGILLALGLAFPAYGAGLIPAEKTPSGILLTQVTGNLRLGDRQLRSGDVLTADQARAVQWGQEAVVCYRLLEEDGLGERQILALDRRNRPPVAEDRAFET